MNTEFTGLKKIYSKYFKPMKFLLLFVLFLAIVSSTLNTIPQIFIGQIIQELKENIDASAVSNPGGMVDVNFAFICKMAAYLAFCYIFNNICYYFGNIIVGNMVQDVTYKIRIDINAKINRLPVSYFDRRQHGTILSQVTNDVDSISNGIQQSVMNIICSALDIVITYMLLIQISLINGSIALLLIPIVFFCANLAMKVSRKSFLKMQGSLADLNGYLQEQFEGFSVIKLNNKEEDSIKGFQEINNTIRKRSFRGSFYSSIIGPVIDLIVHLVYILMIVLVCREIFSEFSTLAVASLFTFLNLIWLIYDPFGRIAQTVAPVQSAMASMKRVSDLLDEKEEQKDPENEYSSSFSEEKISAHVEFKDVDFSYSKDKPLITNLNINANAGQKIAIVGPTGAGKTTIINLLMRFYDPDSGKILVSDIDNKKLKRRDLRSLFGMVLQDTWLYHDTIMENIRFGKLDASDEEVISAAKTANIDYFIRTLPDGYKTIINEDSSNISAGQKQLLTIARVIIKNPKILILDEATSSVDTRLEVLIQEAMDRVMKGKTSFIIAHRLSTIREADLILVMESGQIVETGTHDALLKEDGHYSRLYNSQFAGV